MFEFKKHGKVIYASTRSKLHRVIFTVATYTSTRILIGITLSHKEEGCESELCDLEAAFIHPYISVEMFIEWPEGIVDLVIIKKEFIGEYCILLGD